MKEILFRGKRTDNGEWIYGFLVMDKYSRKENNKLIYDTRPIIIPAGQIGEAEYDGDGYYYNEIVIPETVGQYTGITADGTKIFEGDVVTGLFDYGLSINAVVAFREGSFGVIARQHGIEHFHPFTSLCNVEFEVIGNIYDNPEWR